MRMSSRLVAAALAMVVGGSAWAAGQFRADLTGAAEVPANNSTATGSAHAKLHDNGTTLRVQLKYSGLSSGVTGAHVHSGAAGSNGPVLIDLKPALGKTAGGVTNLVTEIDAGAATQLRDGGLYVNVHTVQYPDGEIRGQLTAHPESAAADPSVVEEAKKDGEADSEY